MIFGREPALVLGLIAALISFAMAFGLQLTDLQLAGINALVLAVISFAIRQSVTGPPAPPAPRGSNSTR